MSDHSTPSDSGYSPPLRIELDVGGRRFGVAEIGPAFLRVRGADAVAPGPAVVRVYIDERLTAFHVDLVDGIEPQRKRQPCRVVDADPVGQPLPVME